MSALVICIGNTARGDDGVAHRVAERLEAEPLPGVRIIAATQLDVVMAGDVAASSRVVFVDAARRAEPCVRVEPLGAIAAGRLGAHSLDPSGLVAIAGSLYGNAPDATLVSVAAPVMGHTRSLSQTAETASAEAVSEIRRLLGTD